MAKKQTRRSISLKGLTYQRVKEYCEAQDRSISGFLEELVEKKLRNVPPVVREEVSSSSAEKSVGLRPIPKSVRSEKVFLEKIDFTNPKAPVLQLMGSFPEGANWDLYFDGLLLHPKMDVQGVVAQEGRVHGFRLDPSCKWKQIPLEMRGLPSYSVKVWR